MSTLSAGDLTNLRTAIGRASVFLSIFTPVTLLTALVNNAAIARGARTIAFDGGSGSGFATIAADQLFEVDTADGLKIARVKAITGSQSSGTITLGENAIDFADNQVIRIKHFYPILGIPPTIRSGVFYKDFDIPYNASQNLTPNPVTIIGSHRVGTLSAGSIAFALNSSSSYAIASGASISSRVWSCVHNGGGASGISFSSTTAANPTLTITEAGQYWLKCIVTDSNGKVQPSYRALFIYDSSTLPYKDFTISGLSGDWQTGGYRFTAQVTGDVELADFPDRTLVVLWYDNTFDGTAGYVDLWGTDAQNVICSGYLRKDQDNDELAPSGTGTVSFEVTTPEAVMDACPLLGSISLNAVSGTPATWYQYASWMTVGRAIHHLLKWHSTVLETCDVYGLTTNTLGVENTDFTESSLLQMVNGLGFSRGHFAKMVSDRRGRLHFVTDSQMLNDAGRAALDTVFTLAVADISGVVDVVRQEEEVVSTVDLDGFYFNGTTATPWIAIAPGYIEARSFNMPEFRGSGGLSIKNQVLNSTQADSNEKAGRVLAQANNNPFEFRFTTPANYLGAFDIVPSIGFYVWGIANSTLKRNTSLNGRKLICRHVDHAINHIAGTIQTSVVFEPEALGPDGIAGNYPVGYPTRKLRVPDASTGEEPVSTATQAILTYYSQTDADFKARLVTLSPLSLGSEVVITGPTADGFLAALDSTRALFVWNGGGGSVFHANVLTASGGTVVVGADNTLFDGGSSSIIQSGMVAISPTAVLLVFNDQRTATDASAVILTVSGDTVTYGTIETLDNTDPVSVTAARLSATAAIAAWRDSAGGGELGYYNIMAINADDVNAGVSASFAAGLIRVPGITTLTSQTAVVFYGRSGGSYHPAAKPIYAITGQTGSLGSENVLDAVDVLQANSANSRRKNSKISTSKSVIGYKETVDDEQFIVAVRYGDTVGGLAAGPVLKIDDNAGIAYTFNDYPQISSVSGTKAVVCFIKESAGGGRLEGRILTASIASDLTCTSDANELSLGADDVYNIDIVALRDVA